MKHVRAALGLGMAVAIFAAVRCSCSPCPGPCVGAERCVDGECRQPCSVDPDCTTQGRICVRGYCEQGNRSPGDAGTSADGGVWTDAAGADSSGWDSRREDTGATDTGATDTGATDTGATDTGATDTVMQDAGSTDTPVSDATQIDTGPRPDATPQPDCAPLPDATPAPDQATYPDTGPADQIPGCSPYPDGGHPDRLFCGEPAKEVILYDTFINDESDMAPFEAATCVILTGNLTINGTNLSNLQGLHSLRQVTGELRIENNDCLRDLRPLNGLWRIGSLYVEDNAVLTDLGLDALFLVDTWLVIRNNPQLPAATAQALADQFVAGHQEIVENNGP